MKLRRVPKTPYGIRECQGSDIPDEIHVSSYATNWGTPRYLVEGRRGGRSLGDRDFTTLEDARAFASLEARWHGARIVDACRNAGNG